MAAICPLFHLKPSPGGLLDAAFRNTHALQDGAQSARAEACVFKVLVACFHGTMEAEAERVCRAKPCAVLLCVVLLADERDDSLDEGPSVLAPLSLPRLLSLHLSLHLCLSHTMSFSFSFSFSPSFWARLHRQQTHKNKPPSSFIQFTHHFRGGPLLR